MDPSRLALVQGIDDTRRTLVAWNAAPWPVLGRWLAGAAVVTALLLLGVLVVAASTTPDPTHLLLPGLNRSAGPGDVARVVARNLLVLTLHAMACVAGFIAGSSLPLQAEHHAGLWRRSPPGRRSGCHRLRRRRDGLLAADPGATSWAATPRHPRGPAGRLRPRCCCSRSCPTRSPSSWRCSCRWRRGSSRAGATPGRSCWRRRSSTSALALPVLVARGEPRGLRLAARAAARVAGGLTRRDASPGTSLCIVLSQARPASPRSPCTTMAGTLIHRHRHQLPGRRPRVRAPRSSSTSGPPGAGRAASSHRSSRRSPASGRPADRQAQRGREPGRPRPSSRSSRSRR